MSGSTDRYLFSEVHNDRGNWEIVNVIAREELSRDSIYIGWIAMLVCIAMLIVCYLLASRISNIITRPLEQLKKNIDVVSEGKFQIEEDFDETEIGRIGTQFKNMVNNNLDLHEKLLHSEIREKEAELLLLQSQINPHFLYNTLDSLYFMAVIEQADEIAEMVLALSDTFKLSLNRGEKLIEVRDEIEKIKAYMKLQNMRYHNRFELLIDMEEAMLDKKILTFILQPVVENAVYHGLEPKMGNEMCIRDSPWTMYLMYGDQTILEEQYDSMKRWIGFMRDHAVDYIWNYKLQFGDWVALDAEEGSYFGATPNDLTCTAYFAHSPDLFCLLYTSRCV